MDCFTGQFPASLFAAEKFPAPSKKFPVPLHREFGCNDLNLLLDLGAKITVEGENSLANPVPEDRFALDCVLSQ
jgi:hypothetical protein